MADLGNRANVNSAIDLLLDDLQPDEAIQPSDHNVLLKDILDTLANGLSTVLRTGNTTDGQNLTITSSSIFQFANGSNGRLQSDTLTAFRNWTLPDATGTIALLSDIPSSVNIYTADGTLTGNRTVDLGDNKLTVNFDVDTAAEVAPVNFEFGGFWQGYTRWANSGAVSISVSNNDDALTIFNTVNSTNFKSKAVGGGYLGLEGGSNNVWRINDGDTQDGIEIGRRFQKFYFGTGLMHRIQQGGTGGGVHFYESGITGGLGYFIVGGNSRVGNEKISFQGSTLIKGDGTSTGSTLALYNSDTTPVKTWDFLDNGNLIGNNNRILNTIVNPSVQETTSTATFTINADEETTGVLTAIALATTIASPTGTPVQGQKLTFRFKDNGTAQSLTWNAIFRAIGLTLPTTTTANKTIYIGFIYNSTETKWDVIAIKEEV